jgi:hypothetical protein
MMLRAWELIDRMSFPIAIFLFCMISSMFLFLVTRGGESRTATPLLVSAPLLFYFPLHAWYPDSFLLHPPLDDACQFVRNFQCF